MRAQILIGFLLLVGVGAERAVPATMTANGSIGSQGFPVASDTSFATAPAFDDGLEVETLNPLPRIDDEQIMGGSAADGSVSHASEKKADVSDAASDVEGEVRDVLINSFVWDAAPNLTPPEDYQSVSKAVSAEPVDDLQTAPTDTDIATLFGFAQGDLLVKAALLALVVLGLPAATLLTMAIVRRRRRTAFARRVKLNFAHTRRRRALSH